MSTLSNIIEWINWFFRGGYREVFSLIFSWFIIIVFIFWLIYVGYTNGIFHYLIFIVVVMSISLVAINSKIKNNLQKISQTTKLKLKDHPLIKQGIELVIQTKQKEYLPFRLIEKTKDILRINPSTSDDWFLKGIRLKVNFKFHDDTYCFERAVLLDPYNAFAWFELADNCRMFFNKNSDVYMKIAKYLNETIEEERDKMLQSNNPEYFFENKKIHATINLSGINKTKKSK